MPSINFILGETRYVDFTLAPREPNDTTVIVSALWRLMKSDGVEEASGEFSISGLSLSALISPLTRGGYTLCVSVTVPPETIKTEVPLYVA